MSEALSEATADAVAEHVRTQWGLVLSARRLDALRAWLSEGAPRRGGESLAGRVLRGDPRACAALADWVTNPETFLFRHPKQFEILHDVAQERLAAGRPLRILSAGCSSGEEAWSAAAVAASVYEANLSRVAVVGWDLSAPRLERAREAVYSQWAHRSGLMGLDRHFLRDGKHVRPTTALRALVRFEERNLVDTRSSQGTAARQEDAFDVIFFRNVSIYWPEERTREVLASLLGRLKGDGVLLPGPSDPIPLPKTGWRLDLSVGVPFIVPANRGRDAHHATPVALRPPRLQPSMGTTDATGAAALPNPPPATPPPPRSIKPRPAPSPPPPPAAQPEPVEDGAPTPTLQRAQELADAGEAEAALRLLEGMAEEVVVDPEASHWVGVLSLSLGRPHAAVEAFRRARFLAPDTPDHRQWLAVALEAAGHGTHAERVRASERHDEEAP